MSEDESIKLGWTVAEKVMRAIKALAEGPVEDISGEISHL